MGLFWNKKKNEPKISYAEARAKVVDAVEELKRKEKHDNLHIEYLGIIDGKYKFSVVSYDEDMEEEGHSLEDLLQMELIDVGTWEYSETFKCQVAEILVKKACNNKNIGTNDADKVIRHLMGQLQMECEVIDFVNKEKVGEISCYRYLIAATGKAKLVDRSRTIPQTVKDAVWNRDNGCCVQCGSNINIEFDHIIPFSKGGSNTYRNIQILCQICNRTKSAKIG